jgi:hypothetical protein
MGFEEPRKRGVSDGWNGVGCVGISRGSDRDGFPLEFNRRRFPRWDKWSAFGGGIQGGLVGAGIGAGLMGLRGLRAAGGLGGIGGLAGMGPELMAGAKKGGMIGLIGGAALGFLHRSAMRSNKAVNRFQAM